MHYMKMLFFLINKQLKKIQEFPDIYFFNPILIFQRFAFHLFIILLSKIIFILLLLY